MVDQTLAKYLNELRILTMLRTQGPASRAEIARGLGVVPATVTRLVNGLIGRDLVKEARTSTKPTVGLRQPGRPAGLVSLNPEGAFFLGVEIGVGVIRFALIDLLAKMVVSSEVTTARNISPQCATGIIADYLKSLKERDFHGERVQSIGVTVTGIVTSSGFVINLPILGWKSVDLLGELSQSVPLPCFVENNANAAALGAVYTHPALPSDCTVFLKFGTGCGGAAIVNGRLLRGADGTAGEFGHIRLSDHGSLCDCGQRSCLESWVNLKALARNYKGTDGLTEQELANLPNEVAVGAERGEGRAVSAVDELTHWISLGIISLVNMLNPSMVILGGVMRPVLEFSLGDIRSIVQKGIMPGVPVPDVRLSELGRYECAIGAATVAHHHAFDISRVEISESELQPYTPAREWRRHKRRPGEPRFPNGSAAGAGRASGHACLYRPERCISRRTCFQMHVAR